MELPGRTSTAQDWLLGVEARDTGSGGARQVAPGTLVVERARARSVAAALGDALVFAEPDRRVARPSSAPDNALDGWARGAVVALDPAAAAESRARSR